MVHGAEPNIIQIVHEHENLGLGQRCAYHTLVERSQWNQFFHIQRFNGLAVTE